MISSKALTHGLILSILSCAGAIQPQALPWHASTPFAVQRGQESAERSAPDLLPGNTPSAPTAQSSAEGTRGAPSLLPANAPSAPTAQSSVEVSDDGITYTDAGNEVAVAAEHFPDFTQAIAQSRTFEQLLNSILRLGRSVSGTGRAGTAVQALLDAPDSPLGSLKNRKLGRRLHLPALADMVDPVARGFFKGYLSPYVEDCLKSHGNIPELISSVFVAGDAVDAVKMSQHVESPNGKYTKVCVPVVAAAKAEMQALGRFNPLEHYNSHLPDAVRELNEYFTNLSFGNREAAGMHLGYLMHLGVFGTLRPSP